MFSDYDRRDYDRNNRDRSRYEDSYSGYDMNSDYNRDFNDRDAYEYRSRNENYDNARERDGYPSSRYSGREDRYERKELNRDFRFNDKFKNLFSRKEKPSYEPQREMPSQQGNFAKNMVIYSPKTYRDVKKLIDCLKNGEPIIVDLADIKHEKGQRILDYLSGALYALSGGMHKISGSIYLFTPDGVNIMVPTELKERIEKDND